MKAYMVIFAVIMALLIFDTTDIMSMDLTQFQWKNRLLFLFAPDSDHPLFKNLQNEIIAKRAEVEDRDMVIFEILANDPSKMNRTQLDRQTADSLRHRFAVSRNTFALILVGKDGGLKLKGNDQIGLEEVFALIDSMPMRQDEMRRKTQ